MRARNFLSLLILVVTVWPVQGCGHTTGATRSRTAQDVDVPAEVTQQSYPASLRSLYRLPLDAPERQTLRKRVVDYLDGETRKLVQAGEYDAVVKHFERMTGLFRPEDFRAGRLPGALEKPAKFLLKRGSERGDEGTALSALLVLHLLHPDDPHYKAQYGRVRQWGRDAREQLPSKLQRYTQLIQVWQKHARLTPAPDVLSTLSKLHIQRRNSVVKAIRSGEQLKIPGPRGLLQALGGSPPHQLLRRAPFDVAAVYLEHGDVASAINRVKAMGDAGGAANALLRVLKDARDTKAGPDAVFELAEAYREARPEVTRGLCKLGLRQTPKDARFPACLARVAASEERYPQATAWYAEAIDLAPKQRSLYDEALSQLNKFIQAGLFESDPNGAREVAKHAERILDARIRRWPDSSPPISPHQLQLLIGRLEMNSGNVEQARKRFQASLDAKESSEAVLQLGMLEARMGRDDEAAKLFRRALEKTPQKSPQDAMKRAEILEHLADAFRGSGRADKSKQTYRRALGLWDKAVGKLDGRPLALVQARRGVILDRLGRRSEAVTAFRAAMAAAPQMRETYASILSHLVIADPAPELAHDVFRRAQRQLTLEPEWKVYFALWVAGIQARAGQDELFDDVQGLLERLSDSTSWWGRLARFGAGKLPYEELLAEAGDRGQRAEVFFYEGTRRLAHGKREQAKELFERVLGTDMVSFYEFIMARELLARMGQPEARQQKEPASEAQARQGSRQGSETRSEADAP